MTGNFLVEFKIIVFEPPMDSCSFASPGLEWVGGLEEEACSSPFTLLSCVKLGILNELADGKTVINACTCFEVFLPVLGSVPPVF